MYKSLTKITRHNDFQTWNPSTAKIRHSNQLCHHNTSKVQESKQLSLSQAAYFGTLCCAEVIVQPTQKWIKSRNPSSTNRMQMKKKKTEPKESKEASKDFYF